MTFFGQKRWAPEVHPHESPKVMTIPLMLLAALSVVGGVLTLGGWISDWLAPVVGAEAHQELGVPTLVFSLIVVAVVAIGIAIGWVTQTRQEIPREAPQDVSVVTRAARADLYGDAINESLFMRPGDRFVEGLVLFDDRGVDGAVDGTGAAAMGMSGTFRRVQTGYVRSYALSFFGGALLVVLALLAVNLA
jgi:NADH-quinone oxidoreductase subunit L